MGISHSSGFKKILWKEDLAKTIFIRNCAVLSSYAQILSYPQRKPKTDLNEIRLRKGTKEGKLDRKIVLDVLGQQEYFIPSNHIKSRSNYSINIYIYPEKFIKREKKNI